MAKKASAQKVVKTAYQKAAEELNEVLGLTDPSIDTTLSDEELKPLLVEAITLIADGDEISEETQEVVDELSAEAPAEEEEEEDGADLADEITACKKVSELQVIIKANDAFKKAAKKLNAMTKVSELKATMLAIVAPEEEEEEQAPAKTPEKPKPAPKANAKKDAKPEGEKKAKGFPAREGKSRIVCICDAVKTIGAKGMTIKAVAEASNKLYIKEGGAGKDNVKQSLHTFKVIMPVLVEFNLIKVDGENVFMAK
jgi:glucan-binding YG repeat protein